MRIPGVSFITLAAFAVFSMDSAPLHAQQSAAECAAIENDRERLECFDRVYAGGVDSDAGRSDTSASTDARPATSDTERARREAEQARREAEQARAEAAQARQETEQLRREMEQERREVADLRRASDRRRAEPEPEVERGTPEERFGMEKKVLELGGEEMSSTAVGEFRLWNKGQRIELDNGQVWEITNDTNLFHKTSNPRVTIEKGMFSAFYLHIDGVSKSLKVRRIR